MHASRISHAPSTTVWCSRLGSHLPRRGAEPLPHHGLRCTPLGGHPPRLASACAHTHVHALAWQVGSALQVRGKVAVARWPVRTPPPEQSRALLLSPLWSLDTMGGPHASKHSWSISPPRPPHLHPHMSYWFSAPKQSRQLKHNEEYSSLTLNRLFSHQTHRDTCIGHAAHDC